MDGSKFRKQFLKRVTQGTFLWNYFKIWPTVSEKKIFQEFLHVPIVREAPIHQSHVYEWIKISQTIFEEGHQRNIPVKLFQNLTSGFGEEDFFKNFFMFPIEQEAPIHQSHVSGRIKISQTIFWKGSPKEQSCEIISKSDQWFQRRRFLKNCLKNSISLPWQPEFLMESNSVNNFWRGLPKEHSCQVWSKLAQRFGRRRCLKKLLRTHDGYLTTLKAPLEHVVLRWAQNTLTQFQVNWARNVAFH